MRNLLIAIMITLFGSTAVIAHAADTSAPDETADASHATSQDANNHAAPTAQSAEDVDSADTPDNAEKEKTEGQSAPDQNDDTEVQKTDSSAQAGDTSATKVTQTPTPTATAPHDPLADLKGRPDAASLSMDALWSAFNSAFGQFQNELAETNEATADTQTGFRSRVKAIGSAMEVRDLLQAMLNKGELSDDDRTDATDTYLTVQQVMGSLMVDIKQCGRAVDLLNKLASNPETQTRHLLLKGTNQWLAKAKRCKEQQDLESQLAAQNAQQDQEKIAQLREKLQAKKAEDARIEQQQKAAEASGSSLVMSRSELLGLLRQSAASRRGGSNFVALLENKRKGLPTHEYGITLYGGISQTPNFAIRALMEPTVRVEPDFEGHYGGSFFVRKKARTREISLNFDYTSLDFGAHWWLRKSGDRSDARWIDIGKVPKYTLTAGIARTWALGKKERFQFHLGGLFGISYLPNHRFDRWSVNPSPATCLRTVGGVSPAHKTSGYLDRFQPGGGCYNSRNDHKTIKLPPILPSIGIRAGFRYVIKDRVSIGIQGGFQDVYFFGNLVVGVIVGKKYAEGEDPRKNKQKASSEAIQTTP